MRRNSLSPPNSSDCRPKRNGSSRHAGAAPASRLSGVTIFARVGNGCQRPPGALPEHGHGRGWIHWNFAGGALSGEPLWLCTTWRETFGNGPAIGTGLTTMHGLHPRATLLETRRDPTHGLTSPCQPSPKRCIEADRICVPTNIARGTSWAREVRVKSARERIILVFDVS